MSDYETVTVMCGRCDKDCEIAVFDDYCKGDESHSDLIGFCPFCGEKLLKEEDFGPQESGGTESVICCGF